MKILITAIGKRVQLIEHLNKYFDVVGVDSTEMNAGKSFVHSFYNVARWEEEDYIKELIQISKKEKVDVIIPLYELEFLKILEEKDSFNRIGVEILLSDKEIINLCKDKVLTQYFMEEENILTPKRVSENEVKKNLEFPIIIKPRDGMGSKNIFIANNFKELDFFKNYVKNPFMQEFIIGDEYTVDVLCDLKGKPIYIIPRIRLEIRDGEVSKTKIVKDREIIKEVQRIIKSFNKVGEGLKGPLTFQFIKNMRGEIYFIELNPRFGGGVPVSFKGGANYGKSLEKLFLGEEIKYSENYEEITMIRYDSAIFY